MKTKCGSIIKGFFMHNKAFTLINWLIAIVFLSIIIGFMIPEVYHQIGDENGKSNFQKSGLKEIKKAIDQFFYEYGRYPRSINVLIIDKGKYINEIPIDPFTGAADWEVRENEPPDKWYINENVKFNYPGSPSEKWIPNTLSGIFDVRPRQVQH